MQKNVGGIDKVLRIIIGLGLIGFAVAGPETGYNAWGWIGIVPLVTALAGVCPAYSLFGIKTCKTETAS